MTTEKRPLRVAILGAGTVRRGGGPAASFATRTGGSARPAAGCSSSWPSPTCTSREHRPRHAREIVVPDAFEAIRRDDVDVVVELIGGDEPARSLIAEALGVGKPVVTANKHVLAHHGLELETAARAGGAALRYEASVCGGTPVLDTIARGLAAKSRATGARHSQRQHQLHPHRR